MTSDNHYILLFFHLRSSPTEVSNFDHHFLFLLFTEVKAVITYDKNFSYSVFDFHTAATRTRYFELVRNTFRNVPELVLRGDRLELVLDGERI